MALVINGTSIPTSGKVVCNGTSLKQLNIGGTKVWRVFYECESDAG